MATESIDDVSPRLLWEAARRWYAATEAAQPRRGSACPHRLRPHGRPSLRDRRMEQR